MTSESSRSHATRLFPVRRVSAQGQETASTSFTLNNNSNLGMFGLINFDGKCD